MANNTAKGLNLSSTKLLGIPYWLGASVLGLLNIGLFWFSGKPWGVTTALASWGAKITGLFGAHPDKWLYFSQLQLQYELGEYQPLLYGSLLNLGIILGAFFAAVINREFRIRLAKHRTQYIAAVLGGILMGYGARLAGGCSIGAFVSGTASLSLHGLVFGLFLLPGVWLGLKLAQRFLYP